MDDDLILFAFTSLSLSHHLQALPSTVRFNAYDTNATGMRMALWYLHPVPGKHVR